MRQSLIIVLCLSLLACASNPLPTPQVLSSNPAALSGLTHYRLSSSPLPAVTDEALAIALQQLSGDISRALAERGYQEGPPAQLLIDSNLELSNQIVPYSVDSLPPQLLGPDQSVQLLHEVSATLTLRLISLEGQTLWHGLINIGLSPTRDSSDLLEQAVERLVQQIPAAKP